MDIFVDILLEHSKELSWFSISAQLGCSATEAKQLLLNTVTTALDQLPPHLSIQCVFNGPAQNNPLLLQLVQTEARKESWPPESYLSSIYGHSSPEICLQSAWAAPKDLELDKSLRAPDDLFYDLYAKAQRAAMQDTLYVAPFAGCILSKLDRRRGVSAPSVSPQTATVQDSQAPLSASFGNLPINHNKPATVVEPQPKAEVKVEDVPPAVPAPLAKPAAKRRKNNPKQPVTKHERLAAPPQDGPMFDDVSPIVALSGQIAKSPELPQPGPPVVGGPIAPTAEALPTNAVPEAEKENLLFGADEPDDDAEEIEGALPAPAKKLSAQASGQSKTKIEAKTTAMGGLGESIGKVGEKINLFHAVFGSSVAAEVEAPPPAPPRLSANTKRKASGGGTLDAFFRRQ